MKMLHENVLGLWHVWQPILKRVSHTSSYSATVGAGFQQKVGNTAVMALLTEREEAMSRGKATLEESQEEYETNEGENGTPKEETDHWI